MKHRTPRLVGLALLAGTPLVASCATDPDPYENHWTLGGVPHRVAYHTLGYQPMLADSYRDYQWQQKQDINLTLRRHFLNHNPENPFEPPDHDYGAPRPPHSILPDPISYFHLESVLLGLGVMAWTGAFIPIPVGSLLGTIEEGGPTEFAEGIEQTIEGDLDRIDQPPPVSEFRVRNPNYVPRF